MSSSLSSLSHRQSNICAVVQHLETKPLDPTTTLNKLLPQSLIKEIASFDVSAKITACYSSMNTCTLEIKLVHRRKITGDA